MFPLSPSDVNFKEKIRKTQVYEPPMFAKKKKQPAKSEKEKSDSVTNFQGPFQVKTSEELFKRLNNKESSTRVNHGSSGILSDTSIEKVKMNLNFWI